MHFRRFWLGLGVTALLFGALTAAWANHHRALQTLHVPQTRTATLLLPGDGGNWLSLRSMTLTLSQPHLATHALTAHVAQSGRVTWERLAPVAANNPVIPVLFADNTHPQRESQQLTRVLRELHDRDHISRVNLVGHSSGGTIALDYLNQAHQAPVQVTHVVCIGSLPNDGEVPVSDAAKLHALVQGRVASYRLRLVHGQVWQTEHSLLHESATVDRQIAQFLYDPS
ncbi:alpha/beta fold hydrolase [Levilactobacillus spicheri]